MHSVSKVIDFKRKSKKKVRTSMQSFGYLSVGKTKQKIRSPVALLFEIYQLGVWFVFSEKVVLQTSNSVLISWSFFIIFRG